MFHASIARSLSAILLLGILPAVPSLDCAVNGGIAHICCSDRCSCEGHGVRAGGRSAHGTHDGHQLAAQGRRETHRTGPTHAPHEARASAPDAATGASCAIRNAPRDTQDAPLESSGVNVPNQRPGTLTAAAEIAATSTSRHRRDPLTQRSSGLEKFRHLRPAKSLETSPAHGPLAEIGERSSRA